MRRTAARIGVVAALALSMGVATAVAPPARADEPTDGLISSPRVSVPPTWSELSAWSRR